MGQQVERDDDAPAPRDRERCHDRTGADPSQPRVLPVPWIRKGRGIHGAWYYIKIRKVGNRIEYYFDNVLALTYTDPKPLKGRRIAIWTQDNYVAFARAKVSYDRRSEPSPAAARTPPSSTDSKSITGR